MKRFITLATALVLGHAAEQQFVGEVLELLDPAAGGPQVCTDTYWNNWKTNNTNTGKVFDTKTSQIKNDAQNTAKLLQTQATALSMALSHAYMTSKTNADAHRNATKNHTMIFQMLVNAGTSKLNAISKIQSQIKKASKDAYLFNLKYNKKLWKKAGTSVVTKVQEGKCYNFRNHWSKGWLTQIFENYIYTVRSKSHPKLTREEYLKNSYMKLRMRFQVVNTYTDNKGQLTFKFKTIYNGYRFQGNGKGQKVFPSNWKRYQEQTYSVLKGFSSSNGLSFQNQYDKGYLSTSQCYYGDDVGGKVGQTYKCNIKDQDGTTIKNRQQQTWFAYETPCN